MDINNEILTPKELAHLFVDGEISEVERTTLFKALSEDAELQDYLAEVIRGEQIMEQYRISTFAPAALSAEIAAKAFGTASAAALQSHTVANLFLRYGLVAGVLAAVLTGGFGFRSDSPIHTANQTAESSFSENRKSVAATLANTNYRDYSHNTDINSTKRISEVNIPAESAIVQIDDSGKILSEEEQIRKQSSFANEKNNEQAIMASIERSEFLAPDIFAPDITAATDAPDALAYLRNRNNSETTLKDAAVTIGGFGSGNSLGSPTRLAAMYIINQEFAFGLQYTARSYSAVIPTNGNNETNPSASGIEAVAQYVENSDILPLGIKPVANFAAGYSRLGPTAFFFAGVSAEAFDMISIQTGVEGNALFYDSRGAKMAAGGLQFAINAGIKF
ncbi:hypothetical protein MASR2M18_08530 [Ignavibacteria bacterium]|nr:hypothetical protein [Bacteroidota bacterium]MCZ2131855.1 hypothetical protein [Bacteroidota bacterium]